MQASESHLRGAAASLTASVLFGLVFYAAGVAGASSDAFFGWRILVTAACSALVLCTPGGRSTLDEFLAVLRSTWRAPLALAFTSGMVGVQMWLFAWTPEHGHALDASLGYLLLPIVLVVHGRVVFDHRVTGTQWFAVGLAAVAVGTKVALSGAFSWVTVAVCAGYGLYFAVRRVARLDLPATFAVEALLISPVAMVLVLATPGGLEAATNVAVLGAGVAGAAAMWAYLSASRLLSMPVFGLLTYVEPVLMFSVALLLGETLQVADVVTYGLLAVALATLSVGSRRRTRPAPAFAVERVHGRKPELARHH